MATASATGSHPLAGRSGARPAPSPQPVSSRRPAKRRHLEDDLQMQVVRFLNRALRGNSRVFAVPNGGRRGLLEARRLKLMGVMPGMSDLGVVNDGRLICLELKAPKGRVSDAQAWCHRQLRAAGAPVYVCRSLGEVIAALRESGVPLEIDGRFL